MSLNKVEDIVCKSSVYIDSHRDHYFNIFKAYNQHCEKMARRMFNKFLHLFIDLQKYVTNGLIDDTQMHIDNSKFHVKLFEKIKSTITLTNHYAVDVDTMIVYLKLTIKMLDKIECDNNLSVKSSSSTSTSSSCKESPYKRKKCGKIANPYKLQKSVRPNITFDQSLKMLQNDTKILTQMQKKLQSIYDMFQMIVVITCSLQKDHFRKINEYNLYDPMLEVNVVDVEYENKLLHVYHEQFLSMVKDTFTSNLYDTFNLTVFLQNSDQFTLCVIDNFSISQKTSGALKTTVIDIGKKQYVLTYLNNGTDVKAALMVLTSNFTQLKNMVYAIITNQKLIKHWLCTINSMLKI
jgi:hypothetical protein